MEHPVRICKQWRYCDVIGWRLIWQCCRLSLPVWSSEPLFIFLWAKEHSAHAIHSRMHPVTIIFLARWRKCWLDRNLPQIWRCNGPFISGFRSSRLRFFASGIHKLVERWDKCLNKVGGYVEKWIHNARKSLHLKFQTGKNLLVFV